MKFRCTPRLCRQESDMCGFTAAANYNVKPREISAAQVCPSPASQLDGLKCKHSFPASVSLQAMPATRRLMIESPFVLIDKR